MSNFVKGCMVQADNGLMWDFGVEGFRDDTCCQGIWFIYDRIEADKVVAKHGGHVLTIVDGSKYVPRNDTDCGNIKTAIETAERTNNIYQTVGKCSWTMTLDDFLRAKINGIAPVPNPKRYLLPLEGTEDENGCLCYLTFEEGHWRTTSRLAREYIEQYYTVSASDLANRPAWAMGIEPVEVED